MARQRRAPGMALWVLRWWRGEAGAGGWLLDRALAPAATAYRLLVRLSNEGYDRGWFQVERAGVPVISVGNLVVGGSGKTPVTAWLAVELRRRGARPAVLHGGYAADEPELHRRWNPDVPVLVGRDRVAVARQAAAGGAGIVLLDDGFQHRRLARDLDLVLVPAEGWTHRPRLLPRGPWREGPRSLRRAHAVAVTRKTATPEEAARVADEIARHAPGAAIAVFALASAGWRRPGAGEVLTAEAPPGETMAVAGVAEPEQFRANAVAAGARVTGGLWFPDHHHYSAQDVERILHAAAGRSVITTGKDAVKLCGVRPSMELWVLEQRVVPERGGEEFVALLERLLEVGLPHDARRGAAGGEK